MEPTATKNKTAVEVRAGDVTSKNIAHCRLLDGFEAVSTWLDVGESEAWHGMASSKRECRRSRDLAGKPETGTHSPHPGTLRGARRRYSTLKQSERSPSAGSGLKPPQRGCAMPGA